MEHGIGGCMGEVKELQFQRQKGDHLDETFMKCRGARILAKEVVCDLKNTMELFRKQHHHMGLPPEGLHNLTKKPSIATYLPTIIHDKPRDTDMQYSDNVKFRRNLWKFQN